MKKSIIAIFFAAMILCAAVSSVAASDSAKISFSAGGGKPVPSAQSITPGTIPEMPADPQKTGYSFEGWFLNASKTVPYDFTTPIDGKATLYAGWEKLPYVSFSAGGGKPSPKKEYLTGDVYTPPEVSKTGYRFGGWFTDSKKTQKYTPRVLTENTKLYALWEKLPAVTFSSKGGKPSPSKQSVNFGDRIEKPADPEKKGYRFIGWYTDSKYTKSFDFDSEINAALKLYAKYEPLPVVTFSAAGAKPAPGKTTLNPGERVTPPASVEKKGYTFDGWFADSRLTVPYDFTVPVQSGKITVYAKWTRDPVVTFSAKGKAPNPAKITVKAGETVSEPNMVSPTGYRLEGWYTDSACTKKYDFGRPVTENLALYANWEKI